MGKSHTSFGIEKGRTRQRPTFSKLVQGIAVPGFCSFHSNHLDLLFRAYPDPDAVASYPQETIGRFVPDHWREARHRDASVERTPPNVYTNPPDPVAPHFGGQRV
jgi:hypothetical protein